jgi:hypothetical protein
MRNMLGSWGGRDTTYRIFLILMALSLWSRKLTFGERDLAKARVSIAPQPQPLEKHLP